MPRSPKSHGSMNNMSAPTPEQEPRKTMAEKYPAQNQPHDPAPRTSAHWGRDYGSMYRQTQRYIREVSASFGLTYNEVITLIYIWENPNAIQDRIAHDLSLDKGTTTKLLKRLEAEGYIERAVDEGNQRKKRVRALPRAESCVQLVNFAIREFNRQILSCLPEETQERFLEELHRVSGSAIDLDILSLAAEVTDRFQAQQEH